MGKKYEPEADECKTHSGYKEFIDASTYRWTCCGAELDIKELDYTYCVESTHRYVEWPDEESKVYFVTRKVEKLGNEVLPKFNKALHTSRFFNNKIIPYLNLEPDKKAKARKALENEPRYCLNNGCETIFKESENYDGACTCHPKYWDFGHTGNPEWWPEQWRCCGDSWETPGCTKTRHRGPLLSQMEERPWKWPDVGAKRYFVRKTSKLWQEKLEMEHVTRKQVIKKYKQVCEDSNNKILPLSLVQKLCLKLHLHILCVSNDISFLYKYQDVVSDAVRPLLDNGSGQVEQYTFVEWWFAPLDVIRPEMAKPVEETVEEISQENN